jgi:enoyl-CoA hydratase
MELTLTGDPMDAERAHHFGLVNVLCEPGQALQGAREMAARIEASAPVAVRASRQVLLAAVTADEATARRLSEEAMDQAMNSADAREGLAAFIEKRPPLWTGR